MVASTTPDQCAFACSANTLCNAFAVGTGSDAGSCWLKDREGDGTPNATRTTYLSVARNPLNAYVVTVGVDYPGNDIAMTAADSSSDCAKACDTTKGCIGFVMGQGPDTGKCWLKRAFGAGGSNAVRASYFSEAHGS